MKINTEIKNLLAIITATVLTTSAIAGEVKTITSPNALCNDGSKATYTINEVAGSNNWAVILPGGGLARNADEYKKRPDSMKTAEQSEHYPQPGIELELANSKYNTVYVPYCSSDLWAGYHEHTINGKTVHFKGRAIIEGLAEDLYTKFENADEIVIAGYSAGAIGIGFNADLINQFGNARVFLDSFWLDDASKDFYRSWAENKNNDRSWVYKGTIKGCVETPSQWVECYPSRERFQQYGIDDVFFVWNIGDLYARPVNKNTIMSAIKSDIKFYDAGYSIRADARKVKGLQDWGHVIGWNEETYKKSYYIQSLESAFKNWLNDSGDATVIDF
jgi:hypothetical protein